MNNIPDNMNGAIIISIISGIGFVLWLLPLVNRHWEINEQKLRQPNNH
jgi:hypothetical protein